MGIARRQRRMRLSVKESQGRYKQMMRTQLLMNACQSLTSDEVQLAIDKGKGHKLSYISTKLDENGVPIEGETKELVLANIDIRRLKMIKVDKMRGEELMKQNSIQQEEK